MHRKPWHGRHASSAHRFVHLCGNSYNAATPQLKHRLSLLFVASWQGKTNAKAFRQSSPRAALAKAGPELICSIEPLIGNVTPIHVKCLCHACQVVMGNHVPPSFARQVYTLMPNKLSFPYETQTIHQCMRCLKVCLAALVGICVLIVVVIVLVVLVVEW